MTEQMPTAVDPTSDVSLDKTLARMSGVLLSAETVETALGLITSLAATTLPGTAGAGVTVVDARGRQSRAASDPVVERADAMQYELDEGPCLTAAAQQRIMHIDDTTNNRDWPRWSAAVAPLGIRSVLSAPLTAVGEPIGAIKVYSRSVSCYDDHSEQVLGLFARQAAILLANVLTHSDAKRLKEGLDDALRHRDVLGQAVGVLIAQGAADEQAAFAMLRIASERTSVRLRDVAQRLVAAVVARHAASANSD
jgi:GAF domain-containing protein